MILISPMLKTLTFAFYLSSLGSFSAQVNATVHTKEQEANKIVSKLYHSLNDKPKFTMPVRLEQISAQFLGRPYLLGALGEGRDARFDQGPLYRTDAFDCETYVTTVLALALADNDTTFKQCLRKIRYEKGQISFISRNHFTSLDWNKNNQKQGFLKDITLSFHDELGKPVAKIASALIDKPSWYKHLTPEILRIHSADSKEQITRLADLKARGAKLTAKQTEIAYIPLTALFNSQGQANALLFAQIPEAAIIEIVRPNWNLREKIGTNLNVSHLGFAFWKKGTLFFREASAIHHKIIDIPLIDYLSQARSSPTIKGINVQVVLPQKPLGEDCSVSELPLN